MGFFTNLFPTAHTSNSKATSKAQETVPLSPYIKQRGMLWLWTFSRLSLKLFSGLGAKIMEAKAAAAAGCDVGSTI